MNQYNVIIYNDEERLGCGAKQEIEKITMIVNAKYQEEAADIGFMVGAAALAKCQFGIEVEFRKEL